MLKNDGKYRFYIDVSGTLKKSEDDVYVGCVLFNEHYKTAFREKFYRDFPSLKSFNKKGSSLEPEKLKKIINFMNTNGIKMSVVVLQRHIIKKAERELKSKIKEIKHLEQEAHIY